MANDEDNVVELWVREETPLLKVRVAPNQHIQIAQYGSDDDRWGIYSCVWDGGLGLVDYFRRHEGFSRDALVVDLGSGTGVVGLGMAASGYSNIVVTDLQDALGLMKENVNLNPTLNVAVEELAWGEPLPTSIKERIACAREILVVGADIVYRKNLFDPLLATLETLWSSKVKCIFATQSTRLHLDEFYTRALERGFKKTHLANVIVPQGMSDELPEVVPHSNVKETGIIHIFELTR
ncbi:lysine methyltransferase [Fragilaria crotonensis]|nr:lysine methyltransferase [Fragilaria crotonensis]